MYVVLARIEMLVRLVQEANAAFPMWVTLPGIVTLARLAQLVQTANASDPMLVTLQGMVTPVRPQF